LGDPGIERELQLKYVRKIRCDSAECIQRFKIRSSSGGDL
jgi:hypothetical protein